MFQQPIVQTRLSTDPIIKHLTNIQTRLDTWSSKNFQNRLSQQAHTAFTHTIQSMLEVVEYSFEEINLNYFLLGKL